MLGVSKPDLRSSRSLWDGRLPKLDGNVPTDLDGVKRGYVVGPEDQQLRMIERTVDLGEDGRYLIVVAGDSPEIDDELRSFDRALVLTFGILAAVLLLTTLQVRFGLAPLKRISEALAAIRAGTAERLEDRFPVEIAPLARETNALIDANREIVERARTHVGNLAHALKTPLSVMINEAPAAPTTRWPPRCRTGRHHARPSGPPSRAGAPCGPLKVVGSVTEVAPVVIALTRTMEKIDQQRGIVIHLETAADVRFRGERQDLEEMVGNLVDNACKWAQLRVSVEVVTARTRRPRYRRFALLSMTTVRGSRRRNATVWRGAAVGSTKQNPAPALACRSCWNWRPSTAAASAGDGTDRRIAHRTGAAGRREAARYFIAIWRRDCLRRSSRGRAARR